MKKVNTTVISKTGIKKVKEFLNMPMGIFTVANEKMVKRKEKELILSKKVEQNM